MIYFCFFGLGVTHKASTSEGVSKNRGHEKILTSKQVWKNQFSLVSIFKNSLVRALKWFWFCADVCMLKIFRLCFRYRVCRAEWKFALCSCNRKRSKIDLLILNSGCLNHYVYNYVIWRYLMAVRFYGDMSEFMHKED